MGLSRRRQRQQRGSSTPSKLLFGFLGLMLSSTITPVVNAELLDSPAPENFLRRVQARGKPCSSPFLPFSPLPPSPPLTSLPLRAATVVGTHVYIDGGELSQLDALPPHSPPPSNHVSNGNNATLSIDLSSSWSASSVQIKVASAPNLKGPRPYALNHECIWPSPDGDGFYVYGGGASYGINSSKIEKSGIWKFVVDDNGSSGKGEWELEMPAPTSPSPPRTLRLTEQAGCAAATTTTTEGLGFSVGGVASAWTDPSDASTDHVTGMVVYDMKRKEWRNETSVGIVAASGSGSLRGGVGVFVPSFGNAATVSGEGEREGEEKKKEKKENNGLVFMLGGSVFAVPATTTTNQPDFVIGFENVTFFDPMTREWYWQLTTGPAPSARERFCAVGAEGKNGTYEMCVCPRELICLLSNPGLFIS